MTTLSLQSCDDFISLIPVYLGGAVFEGRQSFVAHIAICESCRHELMESARLAKELVAMFESTGSSTPDYLEVFAAIVGQLTETEHTERRVDSSEAMHAESAELAIASSLMRGIAGTIKGVRIMSKASYWACLGRTAVVGILPNGL